MPEGTERRAADGKPPTALMQSYQAMTRRKRKELKTIGYVLLMFSLVTPVISSIAISAFGGAGLPPLVWLFCGVGMIVGLSLSWPEMGIYLLSRLPSAVVRLLPSRLIDRPERRG